MIGARARARTHFFGGAPMPLEEWYGDDLARDMGAASEDGLDAAAEVLVGNVVGKLSRRGVGAATLRQGLKEIRRAERRGFTSLGRRVGRISAERRTAIKAAQNELSTGGLVDPPGGHPRKRDGMLAGSAGYERSRGRRTAGYALGPASTYGPVHEFGAVIRPKSSPWLLFQLLDGSWRRAKQVTIPARPVWRPAFRESRPAMLDAFVMASAAALESGGGTGG